MKDGPGATMSRNNESCWSKLVHLRINFGRRFENVSFFDCRLYKHEYAYIIFSNSAISMDVQFANCISKKNDKPLSIAVYSLFRYDAYFRN